MATIWNLGIGSVSETALMSNFAGSESIESSLVSSIFTANSPQLIFSILYFLYNGIFTAMLAGKEWSDFGVHRKPIRVSSDPKGWQRSRYFLQLPYRFSIPLILTSIAVHWLISRSIFVVAIEKLFDENPRDWHLVTCGYSPPAIILVIAVSLLMAAAVAIVASWRLPSTVPVVGSCSIAIAAACHHPDGIPQPCAPLAPLAWGLIQSDKGISCHCGFSSEPVDAPMAEEYYS